MNKKVISFVGPNGSGKSTILESIAIILTFFKLYSFDGFLDTISNSLKIQRTTKPIWDEAILKIEFDGNETLSKLLKDTFGITEEQKINKIAFSLSIKESDSSIFIRSIKIEDNEYNINYDKNKLIDCKKYDEINGKINILNNEINMLNQFSRDKQSLSNYNIGNQSTNIFNSISNTTKDLIEKKITILNQKNNVLNNLKEQIKLYKSDIPIRLSLKNDNFNKDINQEQSNQDIEIDQDTFDQIIDLLKIPDCYYLESNHNSIEHNINEFYLEVQKYQKQAYSEEKNSDYRKLITKMNDFFKNKVSFGEDNKVYQIFINKLPLGKSSLGTFLSVGFFSIINKISENGIILWDEPENSLHPTRRNKLFSLMKNSNRKFVIGTHATEFAQIIDKDINIYKLTSKFDINKDSHSICSIKHVSNILESFDILKVLGSEPSKTLFTSNCIIWLEGPSDVIYFRFWINKYIEQNELDLIEGFDYTFVLSSGSLLAHYTFHNFETGENIEQNKNIDSIINVLSVSPSSIFISDSDIKSNLPNSITEKDFDENRSNNNFPDELKNRLKPRVKNIIEAIEKLSTNNDSSLLITYGRETENYIKNDVFIKIVKYFYGLDEKDNKCFELADNIKLGRWDGFIESIEKEFLTSKDDKIFNSDNGKIKYKDQLERKKPFALKYVDFYEKNSSFSFSDLSDDGRDIEIIVNKIIEIKEKYYY